MSTSFPPILQRYVKESFVSSWSSFGIATEPTTVKQHQFTAKALAAVIGVAGDGILGTFLVAVEERLLLSIHPMGAAAKGNPQFAADWIGEIANLTIGTINTRLGEDGHMVKISPPSVEAHALQILRRYGAMKPTKRFWLAIGAERVCCQLSVDVEPGLLLGKAS